MSRFQIPQPTILDRLVSAFSPARGVERLRARTQLAMLDGSGGYNAGRRDRRATKRWRPAEGSADADTLLDLPDLRARSRDLARNTPLATGAILTTVTGVVGNGLQLQACVDDKALGITPERADQMELEQEREWELFCKTCDFTRVQPFDEMQALAFRSTLESGDVFLVRRYRRDAGDAYGTKLQLLEADRVSNPSRASDTDQISGGVETDQDGVPQAYHVSNKHPGALRLVDLKWERVSARDQQGRPLVLHLFDRTRPELTRGVPYLAPVIEHLKQLGDYADAEVAAAVVSAMFTVFVTSETPDGTGIDPIVGETAPQLAQNEIKLGNGAVIGLGQGDDVKFADPKRPNAAFDPFVQAFCRQIGVALELPFEVLIKHFTASYSASRAALEMAWQFFRRRRHWLAARLLQPAYEMMMEEAVASGRLNRPGFFADPGIRAAYCGAEWIGPQRASLNPKQESDADRQDVEMGFKTGEQVCMERTGGEFEKKIAQRGKEEALRKAAGLSLPGPAAAGAGAAGQDTVSDSDAEDQPQNRSANS